VVIIFFALQYSHDGKIHMETERRIPTDGLVLRGYYNAITLVIQQVQVDNDTVLSRVRMSGGILSRI